MPKRSRKSRKTRKLKKSRRKTRVQRGGLLTPNQRQALQEKLDNLNAILALPDYSDPQIRDDIKYWMGIPGMEDEWAGYTSENDIQLSVLNDRPNLRTALWEVIREIAQYAGDDGNMEGATLLASRANLLEIG